jgi:hypothetical protein
MIDRIESQIATINELMEQDRMINITGEVEMGNGDRIRYILRRIKKKETSHAN